MATKHQNVRLKSQRSTLGEIPPVPTVTVTTSGSTSATASYRVLIPGPIQPGKFYHLIRLTSTTSKLAATWADKNAGTAIDLIDTPAMLHQKYSSVEFQTSTNGTTWTTQTSNPVTLSVQPGTTVYARARTFNGTNYSPYGTANATTQNASGVTIPLSTTSFNGASVTPGTFVTIAPGARNSLTITGLKGTASSRIIVQNDPTTNTKVSITSNTGNEALTLDTCEYVTVTGNARAGVTYGIYITRPATAPQGTPDQLVKLRGKCKSITFQYCELDGKWDTTTPQPQGTVGATSGFNMHDQNVTRAANPGYFLDGHKILHCWVHHIPHEGIYFGPNFSNGGVPMANCEVAYNLVEWTGWDGMQCKSWYGGANSCHDNVVRHAGWSLDADSASAGQHFGISLYSSYGDVYNNLIEDTGENGIHFVVQNGPPNNAAFDGYGPFPYLPVNCWNNVVRGAGRNRGQNPTLTQQNVGRGILTNTLTAGAVQIRAHIYSCTIVSGYDDGIRFGNSVSTSTVENCIIAGNAGGTLVTGSSGNVTEPGSRNTKTTAAASTVLTDPANGNYTPLAGQPNAGGTAGTNYSTTDINGVTRDANPNRGAVERVG